MKWTNAEQIIGQRTLDMMRAEAAGDMELATRLQKGIENIKANTRHRRAPPPKRLAPPGGRKVRVLFMLPGVGELVETYDTSNQGDMEAWDSTSRLYPSQVLGDHSG